MKNNSFLVIAAFSMAIAVSFGALGAHALKSVLSEASLASWKTGVLYQTIHSIALIGIVLLGEVYKIKSIRTTLILMTVGFITFSGSIYLLSLKEVIELGVLSKILGPITPLGGLLMISAWVLLGIRTISTGSNK